MDHSIFIRLFDFICRIYIYYGHLLARFLKLSTYDELVQNEIHLMEVKYEIQLTYILEILVEDLHEEVNRFQSDELVVSYVTTDCKEEASIATID